VVSPIPLSDLDIAVKGTAADGKAISTATDPDHPKAGAPEPFQKEASYGMFSPDGGWLSPQRDCSGFDVQPRNSGAFSGVDASGRAARSIPRDAGHTLAGAHLGTFSISFGCILGQIRGAETDDEADVVWGGCASAYQRLGRESRAGAEESGNESVGGIPDIVKNQRECLVITPHSVEAIEQAIIQLMDNPELGREMGARGHELILGGFTWAHNAERHARLFETVLSEPHGQKNLSSVGS